MVYDRVPNEPPYAGIATFLKLPHIDSPEALATEAPDAVILGAPIDMGTTNRPGARFGPRAIRAASNLGRGSHHIGLGVQPLRVLKVFDYGDASVLPLDLERSHAGVRSKVAEVRRLGAVPIVLGGDHSITLPSVQAVAGVLGAGNIGVVHFDAHADTADDDWGSPISHGTPIRRLIQSGAVHAANFVQVGLRGYWPDPEVFAWMRDKGMRWHTTHEIDERGFDAVLETALAEALEGPKAVYLSVDVDVLDPAYAPATGTPEPGGLTARELLRAVRKVALAVDLVGMDVVEVAPAYDGPGAITAEVAHRVVMEVLSALAARKLQRTENGRASRPGATVQPRFA
jgi:agmatinase